MGSVTAQIIVGTTHPYHGGIVGKSALYLWENDRPAWVLTPLFMDGRATRRPQPPVRWNPTVERMLEDALVMVGVYVVRDKALLDLLAGRELDAVKTALPMYDVFTVAERDALYAGARSIKEWPYLVLTVLDGSTTRNNLAALEHYSMDVDVCLPCDRQARSAWASGIKGSLPTP